MSRTSSRSSSRCLTSWRSLACISFTVGVCFLVAINGRLRDARATSQKHQSFTEVLDTVGTNAVEAVPALEPASAETVSSAQSSADGKFNSETPEPWSAEPSTATTADLLSTVEVVEPTRELPAGLEQTDSDALPEEVQTSSVLPDEFSTSSPSPKHPPHKVAVMNVYAKCPHGDICSGPQTPEHLPEKEQLDLRKKLQDATRAWGFFTVHSSQWTAHRGRRVLDVGMGQGPIGVVALGADVSSYTGLDPAVCINQHACTRNKNVIRTVTSSQCIKLGEQPDCAAKCAGFLNCLKVLKDKYKPFPFTGVQMMQAFPGKLTLLPGTFESLRGTGLLTYGQFDVATLWTVTEHLPDNVGVIKGIFEWLEPGKTLCLKHHNYYGYDGHHGVPMTPAQYKASNPSHKHFAQWRHLDPDSPPHNKSSLNRVRLGDLIALVNIFFTCAWTARALPGVHAALTKKLRAQLVKRGFAAAELLASTWEAACKRRTAPENDNWLADAVFHHPATDGSYTPQSLPSILVEQLDRARQMVATFQSGKGLHSTCSFR